MNCNGPASLREAEITPHIFGCVVVHDLAQIVNLWNLCVGSIDGTQIERAVMREITSAHRHFTLKSRTFLEHLFAECSVL
jgi:hypothetical protein